MTKIDFKQVRKDLYAPPVDDFQVVEVPSMRFAMVDGNGDPNTSAEYQAAVEWLFTVSYAVRNLSKTGLSRDYVVPPLEGLWWADDMSAFSRKNRDAWKWTAMIRQPDWITPDMFDGAVAIAKEKLGAPPRSLRLEEFDEGRSVQIMHRGPWNTEAPTIAVLHSDFLPSRHLVANGRHHEIYLSDPRRVAPDKLKTVIRQPVRPA